MATYDNFKHKQHYVWRHYLKSWSINDQLFCLRADHIFLGNIRDHAQKRDFYRAKDLSSKEIELLFAFIKTFPPHVQDLQKQVVEAFTLPHTLKKILKKTQNKHSKESFIELNRTLDIMINNIEEEMHADIENNSSKFITSINFESIEFWNNSSEKLDFLQFICLQMLRTNKLQESLYKTVDRKMPTAPELKNIWGVMRNLTAINVASSLYGDRNYTLQLLLNNSKTPFITSDQPVINTFSHGFDQDVIPKEFEIFYPTSPKTGVLIGKKTKHTSQGPSQLSESDVKHYNDLIYKSSYENVYSNNCETLKSYRKAS